MEKKILFLDSNYNFLCVFSVVYTSQLIKGAVAQLPDKIGPNKIWAKPRDRLCKFVPKRFFSRETPSYPR
jgi:hypothetical protein